MSEFTYVPPSRSEICGRIVDLCRQYPEGLHRLVILAKVRGSYGEDIQALINEGRLVKTGYAPTLLVAVEC